MIIQKTLLSLQSIEYDIKPLMDLLFITFYDTIITNMKLEYIPPDVELIIIQILATMDIA